MIISLLNYSLIAQWPGHPIPGSTTGTSNQGIINPVISQSIGVLTNQADSAVKLAGFIAMFLRISLILGSVFSLLYLVWGAFEWIVSGGDKGAIENARNKIIHAVIGLSLVALVLVLINFIGSFLQIDLLNLIIPTASNL